MKKQIIKTNAESYRETENAIIIPKKIILNQTATEPITFWVEYLEE